MQLYNIERKQQQLLEGVSGCFANLPVTDSAPAFVNNLFAFCEKKSLESVTRLHIMEVGNPSPGQQKLRVSAEIQMAPDAAGDFPVLM